jgi:hypothetical protein
VNDTTTTLEALAHERANWPADVVILEAVQLRAVVDAIVVNMDALRDVVQDHVNPAVDGSIERAAGALTAIGILRDYTTGIVARVDELTATARRDWAAS